MKTTYKLIITTFLCGFSLFVMAQQTVSAHIVGIETREPIVSASVISSASHSITNIEGGFIVRADSADYLQISHVSYVTQNIPVRNLGDTIFLQPKIVELAELIIVPREVIIRDLRAVWDKYHGLLRRMRDRNLPQQTFYYRQLTQNNDVYVEYIESFFTAPTCVRVGELSLQEGRFARAQSDSIVWITNYFASSRITPFSLQEARTRHAINSFLVKDFDKHYDISITRIISSGNEDEVVVYQFTPYRDVIGESGIMLSGQLYVRTKDRTIVRMEANTRRIGVFGIPSVTNGTHYFVVTYREGITNFPIVESVRTKTEITHLRDGQPHQIKIQSTLHAVDYPIRSRGRRVRWNDNLLRRVADSRYNQEFWDNNPFVKRTRVEQRVLNDFNRAGYFGTMNLNE